MKIINDIDTLLESVNGRLASIREIENMDARLTEYAGLSGFVLGSLEVIQIKSSAGVYDHD